MRPRRLRRGNPVNDLRMYRAVTGFNEAAATSPRKRVIDALGELEATSFNEAAATSPRKPAPHQ